MTLCLAWKQNNQIHFASDSRIGFGANRYTDVAIKVFSIPVKIFTATDAQTGERTLRYDHTIGMCVAGSTTSAYLVKESVYEVLQRLQYTDHTDFSMAGIGKLVAKFYEHTSRKICEQIADQGIATFFLAGYCPATNSRKVYKFSIDTAVNPIAARFQEILAADGLELLGSGATRAREILAQAPAVSKFKLLKEVIEDPNVPSVGGNIQYGTFDGNDFVIKGVQDYKVADDGQVQVRLNLRGTEMYEGEFAPDYDDFVISYSFILPFQADIQELLNRRR